MLIAGVAVPKEHHDHLLVVRAALGLVEAMDPLNIQKILPHLKLAVEPPPIAPAPGRCDSRQGTKTAFEFPIL